MSDGTGAFAERVEHESQRRSQTFEGLLSSLGTAKVFGDPVVSGQHVVITASEVATGAGFGSGIGFGMAGRGKAMQETSGNEAPSPEGAGGGGGGGAGFMGRPVAAIVVGPEGVQVKPVLDLTKLSLAGLTSLATILVLVLKMLKKR